MKRVSITLTEDIHKKLKEISKDNERTVSGQIAYWVKTHNTQSTQ